MVRELRSVKNLFWSTGASVQLQLESSPFKVIKSYLLLIVWQLLYNVALRREPPLNWTIFCRLHPHLLPFFTLCDQYSLHFFQLFWYIIYSGSEPDDEVERKNFLRLFIFKNLSNPSFTTLSASRACRQSEFSMRCHDKNYVFP